MRVNRPHDLAVEVGAPEPEDTTRVKGRVTYLKATNDGWVSVGIPYGEVSRIYNVSTPSSPDTPRNNSAVTNMLTILATARISGQDVTLDLSGVDNVVSVFLE